MHRAESDEDIRQALKRVKFGHTLTLRIQTLNGGVLRLECTPNDSVAHVKELIEAREGVPREQIRLVFNGALLVDARKLYEYDKVQNNCAIYMVLALRGGQHTLSNAHNDVDGDDGDEK